MPLSKSNVLVFPHSSGTPSMYNQNPKSNWFLGISQDSVYSGVRGDTLTMVPGDKHNHWSSVTFQQSEQPWHQKEDQGEGAVLG